MEFFLFIYLLFSEKQVELVLIVIEIKKLLLLKSYW